MQIADKKYIYEEERFNIAESASCVFYVQMIDLQKHNGFICCALHVYADAPAAEKSHLLATCTL